MTDNRIAKVKEFVENNIDKNTPASHEELKRLMELAKSDPVLNNSQILIVQEYTKRKN